MADVLLYTQAKADAIIGASVVSASINGAGHLILARNNGSTIDAGDFTAIVGGILTSQINAALGPAVASAVTTAVSGAVFAKGNVSGVVDFDAGTAPVTSANIANAVITATLTGNITIDASTTFPSGVAPGTTFAVKLTQDATGGRTVTFAGIKRSQGVLTLSTGAGAIDILTFFYDGTSWYVGFMGVNFS